MSDVVFMQKFFADVFNHEHQQSLFGLRTTQLTEVEQRFLVSQVEGLIVPHIDDDSNIQGFENILEVVGDVFDHIQEEEVCDETSCSVDLVLKPPSSDNEMKQQAATTKRRRTQAASTAKTLKKGVGKVVAVKKFQRPVKLATAFKHAYEKLPKKQAKLLKPFFTALVNDIKKPTSKRKLTKDNNFDKLEAEVKHLLNDSKQATEMLIHMIESLKTESIDLGDQEAYNMSLSILRSLCRLFQDYPTLSANNGNGVNVHDANEKMEKELKETYPSEVVNRFMASSGVQEATADIDQNAHGMLNGASLWTYANKMRSAVVSFVEKHKKQIAIFTCVFSVVIIIYYLYRYWTKLTSKAGDAVQKGTGLILHPTEAIVDHAKETVDMSGWTRISTEGGRATYERTVGFVKETYSEQMLKKILGNAEVMAGAGTDIALGNPQAAVMRVVGEVLGSTEYFPQVTEFVKWVSEFQGEVGQALSGGFNAIGIPPWMAGSITVGSGALVVGAIVDRQLTTVGGGKTKFGYG